MNQLKAYTIYALIDPNDQSVRYVGQTVQSLNQRLSKHVHKSKLGKTHSASWIRSLTALNLKPSIIELESGIWSQEYSDQREIHWIAVKRENGCNLTNHTVGGNADNSHQLTEEYRKEHSERMKKWHSENPDKKRKAGSYKHSDSTKAKISRTTTEQWSDPKKREVLIGARKNVVQNVWDNMTTQQRKDRGHRISLGRRYMFAQKNTRDLKVIV